MSRISLDLPEKFVFTAELTIRASDLNYGGHVGNDTILTLMQESRIQFYRNIGFKDEVSFQGNIGQIVSDAAVVYKSESFLGDEITIQIGIADLSKYGFDMYYLMENRSTGKEIARAKTGILCFDYQKRKVASIPEKLKAVLQA